MTTSALGRVRTLTRAARPQSVVVIMLAAVNCMFAARTLLAQPANVNAVAGNREVILNWDPQENVHWKVYWSDVEDFDKASVPKGNITAVSTNTHVVPDLTPGQTYYFRVTRLSGTVESEDPIESQLSTAVSATPVGDVTGESDMQRGLTPAQSELNEFRANEELARLKALKKEEDELKEARAEYAKKDMLDNFISLEWYAKNFSIALGLTYDLEKGRIRDVKIDDDRIIQVSGDNRELPRVLLLAHQAIQEGEITHGAFIAVSLYDANNTSNTVKRNVEDDDRSDLEKFITGMGFGYLMGAPAATTGSHLSIGLGIFTDFNVLTLKDGIKAGDSAPAGANDEDLVRTRSFTSILAVATWTF